MTTPDQPAAPVQQGVHEAAMRLLHVLNHEDYPREEIDIDDVVIVASAALHHPAPGAGQQEANRDGSAAPGSWMLPYIQGNSSHPVEAQQAASGGEAVTEPLVAALLAVQKIFDRPVVYKGDGPNSEVIVPFESHTQAWNYWHEARDVIRAALALAQKGEA